MPSSESRFVRLSFRLAVPIAILAGLLVQLAWAQSPAPASSPTTQAGQFTDVLRGDGKLSLDDAISVSYWQNAGNELIRIAISFIPRLIVAVLLFGIFYAIYRIVRKLASTSMKAAGLDESIRDMLNRVLKVLILGFGLVIAGNQVGIEIAALLTGVSILGLAVGFAAQESISNFIAGVMIFLDKPFKVGDWINVDGHLGQVRRVTFRSTRLVDLDGDVVILPNTAMLNRKLVNKSENPVARCTVSIPVRPGISIDDARRVVVSILERDPRIEKTPPPELVIKSVAISEMYFQAHFWIREERYQDAMTYEYLEIIKRAFDNAGITKSAA